MNEQQKYLLQSLGLVPYAMSEEDLNVLKTIFEKEIEMRRDIRNKTLKLKLAEKVEAETGKDQHLKSLQSDLRLAQRTYAKRLSDFDEYKYYPGYLPTNENGVIMSQEEIDKQWDDRLKPLDETTWQVSEEKAEYSNE